MKNILIVSPHPDDVCFALGGSVMKYQSKKIYVWNLFTVQNYNILNETSEKAQQRILSEENTFLSAVHAEGINENFLEAELRGYHGLKNILFKNISKIFLDVQNKEIYDRICVRASELINRWNIEWVGIPLGVGGHIDHILSRNALLDNLEIFNNVKIFLYEELPYSVNLRWISKALKDDIYNGHILEERFIDISDQINIKVELMSIYKSQLDEASMMDIVNHANGFGYGKAYERIWLFK